ncbi:MAG: polysaccharide deacetylase family protein [Acidimicrobiales bacterium]
MIGPVGRRQQGAHGTAAVVVLLLAMLVAGLAACSGSDGSAHASGTTARATTPVGAGTTGAPGPSSSPGSAGSTVAPTTTLGPAPPLPPITAAVPGPPQVISHGPAGSPTVALTFDDGLCGQCIGNMVADLERTGTHATFCPNGAYGKQYAPYVDRIRDLVARGRLTICNHTWDHKRITTLSNARLTDEIQRNERWIEDTFGVSGRPYFRPPYGSHDARTDRLAASLGYTKIIVWSSTLSDSTLQTPATIVDQLQTRLIPSGIVLGHLNYLPTGEIFDQLLAVLDQRGLRPVTIAELLAPPPPTG